MASLAMVVSVSGLISSLSIFLGRGRIERVAVVLGRERLDRARHRGVDLDGKALQRCIFELLVGHDQADRGVSRAARIGRSGRRRVPIRFQALRKIPQQLRGHGQIAPRLRPVAGDQPAGAIGHRAVSIHHREGGDLDGADLAERGALPGMRVASEETALHRHPSGALGAQRKHPGPHRAQRGLRQALVRIDFVEPPRAEIVDDGARHNGYVEKIAGPHAVVLEPGRDRGDGFLAVSRAAREHDGVGERTAVAEPQQIGVDRSRPAAADIDRHRRALRKPDHRDAGRSLFVTADADFDRRPVERQNRTIDCRVGNEAVLIGRDGNATAQRGKLAMIATDTGINDFFMGSDPHSSRASSRSHWHYSQCCSACEPADRSRARKFNFLRCACCRGLSVLRKSKRFETSCVCSPHSGFG